MNINSLVKIICTLSKNQPQFGEWIGAAGASGKHLAMIVNTENLRKASNTLF